MGAAGITIIIVALFFGWEAYRHFRAANPASAASPSAAGASSGASGGNSTGSSVPASGSPSTAGASSNPNYQSQPSAPPNGNNQATAQDIQHIIQSAQSAGISPDAVLALAGWESNNYDTTAYNGGTGGSESSHSTTAYNGGTGGSESSYSLFQINKLAHPDYTCGFNASCNIDYWFANFGAKAKSLYDYYGGDAAFYANPSGFLQAWAPAVQSSAPWNSSIAATAIQRANAIRGKYGV